MFRHDEPVCLLEMFYASNAVDAAWGTSPEGKAQLVDVITDVAQVLLD
jgi:N-acetylmuramoyl-L-alanine amidase